MEEKNEGRFVNVVICTSSGYFPDEGVEQVPINQKIRIQIEKANRELNLVDTNGWIATIENHDLNIENSYAENGLSGNLEIDWGQAEGGGGNA